MTAHKTTLTVPFFGLKIELNGHSVSEGQFVSFILLQATLISSEAESMYYSCVLEAGAHLKWLLQCEDHRADTWHCAVPAVVLGTVVACIVNVCTGVINLKRRR